MSGVRVVKPLKDGHSITASRKDGRVILTTRNPDGSVGECFSLSPDNAEAFARNILDHARFERMALAASQAAAKKTRAEMADAVAKKGRRGAKGLLRVVKVQP